MRWQYSYQSQLGRIRTCQNFGFTGGTLSCYPPTAAPDLRCRFNTSQCTPLAIPEPAKTCGDLLLARGEQCEIRQNNTLPLSCLFFDTFGGGDVQCNSCFYDISACIPPVQPVCGNDVREGIGNQREECDGTDWGDVTSCANFTGYSNAGTLQCVGCKFNLSKCVAAPQCNNNILEDDEQCDGNNTAGAVCTDFGFDSGTLGCTSCKWNTSSCKKGRTWRRSLWRQDIGSWRRM